jgi:hypothetical protein
MFSAPKKVEKEKDISCKRNPNCPKYKAHNKSYLERGRENMLEKNSPQYMYPYTYGHMRMRVCVHVCIQRYITEVASKKTLKQGCFRTHSKSSFVSIILFLFSSSKSVWSYLKHKCQFKPSSALHIYCNAIILDVMRKKWAIVPIRESNWQKLWALPFGCLLPPQTNGAPDKEQPLLLEINGLVAVIMQT